MDVPAGDMGVGGREIGYLFGQYRRLKGAWENGVLTGKGLSYGGSLIRPEATGYGAVYYLQEVLKHEGDTIEGKRIALSGYGNVAWGIMKKAAELGAKVTYMSGPDGYVHDPDGINTEEKLNFILEMRAKDPMHCKPYADRFGCEFVAGAKHWGAKDVDVNMPSAMQNDVCHGSRWPAEEDDGDHPQRRGCYIEVANMPTTNATTLQAADLPQSRQLRILEEAPCPGEDWFQRLTDLCAQCRAVLDAARQTLRLAERVEQFRTPSTLALLQDAADLTVQQQQKLDQNLTALLTGMEETDPTGADTGRPAGPGFVPLPCGRSVS